MRKFIRLDADGQVSHVGAGRIVPEGAIEVDPRVDTLVYHTLWMDETGALVARPVSPDVTATETGYVVADCPQGTTIEIVDVSGQETLAVITADAAGFSQAFSLPDAGEYEVTVKAPAPHIATIRRITC